MEPHPQGLGEYLIPEYPRELRAAGRALRDLLLTWPGVAGAWQHPRALADRPPAPPSDPHLTPSADTVPSHADSLLVLALVDDGWEGAEAVTAGGRTFAVSFMAREAIEDALAVDAEVAQVLAYGYRLCGGDSCVTELEALARATVS